MAAVSNNQHRILALTINEFYNIILKLIRKKPGYRTISPEKQLLIAIWKMATPDSYRSICEKFNVGKATALKSVRRIIKALIELAPNFITWPSEERSMEIHNCFIAISSFPKVIGAIDGTHINIPAPHENPECYVNRKEHHSIQLQAICDHQCRFIHCYIGNVSSVHDQRVFRLLEVYNYLNDPIKFPDNCYLIGDATYTIHEHLLVPNRDNGHLSARQRNFNFCHASAQMAIERTFGLLKGKFRSLLTVLERVDIIPSMILACCVLHNIYLRGDEFENIDPNNVPEPELAYGNNVTRAELVTASRRGLIKRDYICEELLMRDA